MITSINYQHMAGSVVYATFFFLLSFHPWSPTSIGSQAATAKGSRGVGGPKSKLLREIFIVRWDEIMAMDQQKQGFYPRCSMYGVFTYITGWVSGNMFVHIPYMERLGMSTNDMMSFRVSLIKKFWKWEIVNGYAQCSLSVTLSLSLSLCVYIYIYIYTHRQRQIHTW